MDQSRHLRGGVTTTTIAAAAAAVTASCSWRRIRSTMAWAARRWRSSATWSDCCARRRWRNSVSRRRTWTWFSSSSDATGLRWSPRLRSKSLATITVKLNVSRRFYMNMYIYLGWKRLLDRLVFEEDARQWRNIICRGDGRGRGVYYVCSGDTILARVNKYPAPPTIRFCKRD